MFHNLDDMKHNSNIEYLIKNIFIFILLIMIIIICTLYIIKVLYYV